MRKDVVLDEIRKELNLKERIVVKIFPNIFIKVYNIARINTVNSLLM